MFKLTNNHKSNILDKYKKPLYSVQKKSLLCMNAIETKDSWCLHKLIHCERENILNYFKYVNNCLDGDWPQK